jgi:hypothetical protein
MIQVTAAAVLDAARKYIAATDQRVASYEATQAVAQGMGLWDDYAHARTGAEQRSVVTFQGQVTRAMAKLTADGTVRKVGKNDKDPYDRSPTNEVWYFTPLAWEKACKDAAEQATTAQAIREGWEWIYDHLVLLGTHPNGGRGYPLTLGPGDLVLLIRQAEDFQR